MIWILEGADGTGKTTLGRYIQDKTKGHLLHASFDKDWIIEEYHHDLFEAALDLHDYQDVIIDRWIFSEYVYGTVFRGKPAYDYRDFLVQYKDELSYVKWVFCENDNAVQNHFRMAKKRTEMFSDMTKVVEGYERIVSETPELDWLRYNFNQTNPERFYNEHKKPD